MWHSEKRTSRINDKEYPIVRQSKIGGLYTESLRHSARHRRRRYLRWRRRRWLRRRRADRRVNVTTYPILEFNFFFDFVN